MSRVLDLHKASSGTSSKKSSLPVSFHLRYIQLCRNKNMVALQEIRKKSGADNSTLDFFGDKLGFADWRLVLDSLFHDQELKTLTMKLRRNDGVVLEQMNTEGKAKLCKQKPVIFTKFVFSSAIESITNCITFNKNLRTLHLEGLPLSTSLPLIVEALEKNDTIKDLSFERSHLGDDGYAIICNSVRYLMNIEKLNLAECGASESGAEHVANMIKVQKIQRYSDSWQQSLRYRTVDLETIPGLRTISLARNPNIGDKGINSMLEVLKDDCWIKTIDLENCGLTDDSAKLILNCIELNHHVCMNVRGNVKVSRNVQRKIQEHFEKSIEEQTKALSKNGKGKPKENTSQLWEQLKKFQTDLVFERRLRIKADRLNKCLNEQLNSCKITLEKNINAGKRFIPEGHVLVRSESLECIIRELGEFEQRLRELKALAGGKLGKSLKVSTPLQNQSEIRAKLNIKLHVPQFASKSSQVESELTCSNEDAQELLQRIEEIGKFEQHMQALNAPAVNDCDEETLRVSDEATLRNPVADESEGELETYAQSTLRNRFDERDELEDDFESGDQSTLRPQSYQSYECDENVDTYEQSTLRMPIEESEECDEEEEESDSGGQPTVRAQFEYSHGYPHADQAFELAAETENVDELTLRCEQFNQASSTCGYIVKLQPDEENLLKSATNDKLNPIPISSQQDIARKILSVRKVKSEIKYIETLKKALKNKESKSDHEFANEANFQLTAVQFETNIGDSAAVGAKKNENKSFKNEMQDSSSSSSTLRGSLSSESETLRYDMAATNVPSKMRNERMQLKSKPLSTAHGYKRETGRSAEKAKISPRSLFFGANGK